LLCSSADFVPPNQFCSNLTAVQLKTFKRKTKNFLPFDKLRASLSIRRGYAFPHPDIRDYIITFPHFHIFTFSHFSCGLTLLRRVPTAGISNLPPYKLSSLNTSFILIPLSVICRVQHSYNGSCSKNNTKLFCSASCRKAFFSWRVVRGNMSYDIT